MNERKREAEERKGEMRFYKTAGAQFVVFAQHPSLLKENLSFMKQLLLEEEEEEEGRRERGIKRRAQLQRWE